MANTTRTPKIPMEYTPISMWGYFGYSILFSIPVIGWIFVIVFAISASNHNLRNFARSQFCLLIIWILLLLVSCFTGLLASVFSGIKM